MDWIKAAAESDLAEGQLIRVEIEGEEVVIAKTEAGEILAADDVCSHEYVLLHEGWLEDHEIECPSHGSKFDMRTGAVLNLPATQPISVYDVKVEDGAVYIRGPKEGLRT